MKVTPFKYDVFVSYRHQEPDKTWTQGRLVPGLESADLKVCIDSRDFRLGAPLVTEMARAVQESRNTLAVVSPAYMLSNFTEFENVLATHLGLELSQHRLIIVMRERCSAPLHLRFKLWLDMSDDTQYGVDLARLIDQLRQPPDV